MKYRIEDLEILNKVLCGELSEKDGSFLGWLAADESHYTLFCQLKGKIEIKSDFDRDQVYQEIHKQLFLQTNKASKSRQKAMIFLATALSIISIISTAYISNRIKREKQDVPILAQTRPFNPGEKNAYLSTDIGESINLSSPFERASDDGTNITNKENGFVVYEKTEQNRKKAAILPTRQELSVPKGGEYAVELSDGTVVRMNSESKLVFPSYFAGNERRVYLSGEAYFEVTKSDVPFIVEVDELMIKVMGTSFNVKSYADEKEVSTTLVEGAVNVEVPGSGAEYLLQPSERLHLNLKTHNVEVNQVDTGIYTSWVEGEFIFWNQTLEEIFSQLSRWYNFEVEYKRASIKEKHFSGSAEKTRNLDYLLNQIQYVTDIKYKKEGTKIILY